MVDYPRRPLRLSHLYLIKMPTLIPFKDAMVGA